MKEKEKIRVRLYIKYVNTPIETDITMSIDNLIGKIREYKSNGRWLVFGGLTIEADSIYMIKKAMEIK